MPVRPSVCLFVSLFGSTAELICTLLFGGVRVSLDEYQIIILVAFRITISTGIFCNEYCILFR